VFDMCNGHDHKEQDMNDRKALVAKMNARQPKPLLPGEVAFGDEDTTLPTPTGIQTNNPAAAMARADAPTGGNGGGSSTGNSKPGASEKQVAYITSLAAERGLEVKAAWLASKASASAAIDALLAAPKAPVATTTTTPAPAQGRPATDKQIAFVRTLLAERQGVEAAEAIRRILNEARLVAPMTAALASEAITSLLQIPKANAAEVEAGVYVLSNGNLARVYFGQQSGSMLLKEVIDGDLVYRGKAERFLAGSRKATIEEVGNWGRATGTCLVCSRRLDDPESVDRGIGPVCYAKMGGD
jgi:hypothetical protein